MEKREIKVSDDLCLDVYLMAKISFQGVAE
jgi:hypothetical protein